MALYKPSELRAFLQTIDAFPKKSLSQNFLIDGNIIRKIVSFSQVQAGDSVLEIGSGPGSLTEALLQTGARVIAIEKDTKFAKALHRLQTPDNRLTVIEGDALKIDLASVTPPSTKVIGNLPYHITTPILTNLLPQRALFESITVMIQKEVATRFLAPAGCKEYGSITLFLNFYAEVRQGFTVEPTCFYPPPRVKSAVIQFILKEPPSVDPDLFFAMTRLAFSQRRKMVRSLLKKKYPLQKIDSGLSLIGKGEKARAEDLTLLDFLTLFKEIEQ